MQEPFYQKARDWTYDMYQSQTVWLRRACIALIMLSVLLMLSLLANILMLPLKEKVPYLYAFDHSTGEITKVGELEKSTLSANWTLSRYLLIHYVIQAESYDIDNLDQPYQQVWAQSNQAVRSQYDQRVSSTNVFSPYKQYGKDKYVTIKVVSINPLNDNTVDVKFEKTLHDRATNSLDVIQKEAIIKWEYTQVNATQTLLDRDPLGFKVTYYQVTQINIEKN